MSSSEGPPFVVWREYQGRVEGIRDYFGHHVTYMGRRFGNRLLRPAEYASKVPPTLRVLRRAAADTAWLQLPPTPLLYTALRTARSRGIALVADCHNSILWRPWANSPRLVSLLNERVAVVLVHNDGVRKQLLATGVDGGHTLVLEDRPSLPRDGVAVRPDGRQRPRVVVPASYDFDEPIAALLGAAARLPHVDVHITGDPRRARGVHDLRPVPNNVTLTGWLSADDYEDLVATADIVLGLTTHEDIQLSGASEAVGHGRAMVLSSTDTLRRLFPRGAVYVDPDGASIAAGLEQALADRDRLEEEVARLREERDARWCTQAEQVLEVLERRRRELTDSR